MTLALTRRQLLGVAAALPAGTLAPQAFAQDISINVGWYPGLLGSYFKRSFLDTYKNAKNVKLIESFDNPRFTQMQASRNSPLLHIGVFTDVLLPLIARSGLVAELDQTKIPNLSKVDSRVPLPVGRFAVPVTYGTWGIAYNAKKVKKPITSWSDLVRADLKGHVSSPNITYNSSVYTLDALASLKGGSLKSPDAGLELMHTIRTNGPGLWDQESIAVGWLKSEEIWVTPYFSGNVLAMMKDPDLADLKFCVPSEGGYALPMSATRVINPTGGSMPEDFINHMLSLEAQETWAKVGLARPVNATAHVPAEVAAVVPTSDRLRSVDWNYFAEARTGIVDHWNKVVNR